jgi:hypothetical protein
MSLKKLCRGVLHVQTADGLRCVELTQRERFSLIWLFRNFKILPEAVLAGNSRNLIAALLGSDRSQLRCASNHADDDDFIIGTVECVTVKAAKTAPRRTPQPAVVPEAAGHGARAVS